MNLSKEDLNRINEFLGAVKENKIVGSVYLIKYTEDGIVKATVVSVYDQSLYYKEQTGFEFNGSERQELELLVDAENSNENSNLNFSIADSGDHSITMMHKREILLMTDLVSGTILFDRIGTMRDKQIYLENENLQPYENTLVLSEEEKDIIINGKKQTI